MDSNLFLSVLLIAKLSIIQFFCANAYGYKYTGWESLSDVRIHFHLLKVT